MTFFIRSSTSLLQCTRRMLSSAVQNAAQEKIYPPSFRRNTKLTHAVRKTNSIYAVVDSDSPVNKILQSTEPIEDKQWATVRQELMQNFQSNEDNVDSSVYDLCHHYKNLDKILDYFKFLQTNNHKLTLSVIGRYFKTLYDRHKPITAEQEEEIIRLYDDLREKYPLLDGKTCTECIFVLSLTKRWKDTFELLDMLKLTVPPTCSVVGAIIVAAFRNDQPEVGWKVINDSIAAQVVLHHMVYTAYLEYCQKNFKDDALEREMEKMVLVWRENFVQPAEHVICHYINVYESLGYSPKFTSVSKQGVCTRCKHVLKQTELTTTEFKLLSVSILKNLIIGKNAFCGTSPEELKRYILFLQTMKPYDVVIDGLNVAFASRKAGQPGSLKSILQIVDIFVKDRKRVLVIGRVHMNWWSKETMDAIRAKADVFLMKNFTQDDPFLLHVSLKSGPQTYFVSRDLMRQHKFKLVGENLDKLFKQWQMSRQYMFAKGLDGKMKLLPPLPFEPNAQKYEDGWHIPYATTEQLYLANMYSKPESWVCLKRSKSRGKQ